MYKLFQVVFPSCVFLVREGDDETPGVIFPSYDYLDLLYGTFRREFGGGYGV